MARGVNFSSLSRPGKKKKNPPIFSHEFIQENHADIVSVICMIMVFGLMIEVTRSLFTPFVSPQHYVNGTQVNATNGTNDTGGADDDFDYVEEEEEIVAGPGGVQNPSRSRRYRVWYYETGPLDACTVFFYTLVWIVVHAVFKEFIFDRFCRQLHLSKVKTDVYYESCNIFFYNLGTFVAAVLVVLQEGYLKDISSLYRDYPHQMTFRVKLFMIFQLSYWLHNIPELYFLKARQEDILSRVQFYILHFIPLLAVYVLHFQRVAIVLLALHALGEIFQHGYTLISLWRESAARQLTPFWTFFFILVRLASVAVATLVFIVGLPKETGLDISKGSYNTLTVRLALFTGVVLLQLWLVWQFTTAQLAALRDRQERQRIRSRLDTPSERRQRQKEKKGEEANDEGEVRARSTATKSKKGQK